MAYGYVVADVFTGRAFGGNPLAVFPDAAGLTAGQMQGLAKELNLSETTFVTPGSAPGHFRVRIFTPGAELPFAGHPTIGTALVLKSLGRAAEAVVLEEGIGPVRVALGEGEATFFLQGAPEQRDCPLSPAELAALLGGKAGEAWQAGYGTAFVLVKLADRAAVAAARLRRDLWEQAAGGLWGHGVLAFAETAPGHVHARMFAPDLGMGEDPATGSAAAALVGSLPGPAEGTARLTITQGVEMGRPSTILATATREGGAVTEVSIGGGAVIVAEGRFTRLP